ncbi:MAG: glycosyltransferase family 39 protein [Bacteroidetes bacterium]|nr:glycosyltransferase family 39 protein [Bacteroidota bacterium]
METIRPEDAGEARTQYGKLSLVRTLWIGVFVIGVVLRIAFVWRPADYRLLNSWRECDYTSIARSFATEGMNILYPRVDWRGDTPGFAEMEFPVLPWTAALLYRVAGYHEEILRMLSALCSVLALFAFAGFARRALPPAGALVATTLFAVNGLLFALSGAIQPEPLQVLFTILTASAAYRWYQSGSGRTLLLASAIAAAAILTKASSAYLGVLLAYVVLRKEGIRAFTKPVVYLSALVALAPPLLWYGWAHTHYLSTGLSLGLSNETHFLSWDLLMHPWTWLRGNIAAEVVHAFAISGVVLAALALLLPWKSIEFPISWYASVWIFYVISADTSGDGWAYYYHCLSIPPACMLMGLGYVAAIDETVLRKLRMRPALGSTLGTALVVLAIVATLAWGINRQYQTMSAPDLEPLYRCAVSFRDHIPSGARIVVRGGTRLDEHRHPVAFNESMVFTWMNRTGFNYAQEDFTESTLRVIAQKGARYWLAAPDDRAVTHVYASIAAKCTLVAHCDQYDLFDISSLARAVDVQPQ